MNNFFSVFNNNECLKVAHLNATNHDKDMLFLLDNDTLLRLNSFDINNSWIINSSNISYNILKLYNCKSKIYNQLIFSRDPYYCYTDYKNKDAFGLFNSNTQITPAYEVNKKIELYNNMDIQDIIKPMSIDEIFHKINEGKKAKVESDEIPIV